MRPLFGYPGGKTKLLPWLAQWLPTQPVTYCEPFCGGLSVYLYLASNGLIKSALLNDLDSNIINLHKAIKAEPKAFISSVNELLNQLTSSGNPKSYYNSKVDEFNSGNGSSPALVYFLIKTSFNNILQYRADNQRLKKAFNGKPGFSFNPDKVLAVSELLQLAEFSNQDATELDLSNFEFCYIDPPYIGCQINYENSRQVNQFSLIEAILGKPIAAFILSNKATSCGYFELKANQLKLNYYSRPYKYTAGRQQKLTTEIALVKPKR